MTPDELRSAGQALYGRWGWQTRLAEALNVTPRTVRSWVSGDTEISGPVELAIQYLLEKRATSSMD